MEFGQFGKGDSGAAPHIETLARTGPKESDHTMECGCRNGGGRPLPDFGIVPIRQTVVTWTIAHEAKDTSPRPALPRERGRENGREGQLTSRVRTTSEVTPVKTSE
jgi:hypothetical protein